LDGSDDAHGGGMKRVEGRPVVLETIWIYGSLLDVLRWQRGEVGCWPALVLLSDRVRAAGASSAKASNAGVSITVLVR
jgi:hypothetical protein